MPPWRAISSMPCLDMCGLALEHAGMEDGGWINLLGLCAGFLTTVSFLPQLLKAWKSRSTHDISTGMFLLFATGVIFWIIYGVVTSDLPVIAANSVTFVFVTLILALKLRYR